MPCLAVLFALAVPRLLILILWFFTNWFRGMFHNLLWPILGFFFLPTTTLWYSAVQNWLLEPGSNTLTLPMVMP